MTLRAILMVGIGGCVGSILRYVLSWIVANQTNAAFWGTLTVNVIGSLLVGLLFAVGREWYYHLAIVGFCGGFTTFSAFSHETFNMLRSGNYTLAAGYIAASVLICLLAVWVGYYLGFKLKSI